MAKKQAKKAVKKAPAKASTKAAPKKAVKKASKKAAPKATKYVYFFGGEKSDGDRTMSDLLGGKGANLAEMANAGLPVPAGFTITTAACMLWYDNGRKLTPAIE